MLSSIHGNIVEYGRLCNLIVGLGDAASPVTRPQKPVTYWYEASKPGATLRPPDPS